MDNTENVQTGKQPVVNHIIENRTPWRLIISRKQAAGEGEAEGSNCKNRYILAPQAEQELAGGWENADLAPWKQQGFIRDKAVDEENTADNKEDLDMITRGFIYSFTAFLMIFGALKSTGSEQFPILGNSLFALFLTLLIVSIGWAVLLRFRKQKLDQGMGLLPKIFTFVLVGLISIGGPLLAFLIVRSDGIYIIYSSFFIGTRITSGSSFVGLGYILQFIFIAVASLLPALLFFLFDRDQIRTLRKRFFSRVIRLDPGTWTIDEAMEKYKRRVDEYIGADTGEKLRSRVAGTMSPLILCTILVTLGWILAIVPGSVNPENITTHNQLIGLFKPAKDLVIYGFLGAYVFALMTLIRRYVVGDLHPKAYSNISIRIILAVIFAWLIEAAPDDLFVFGDEANGAPANNAVPQGEEHVQFLSLMMAFVFGFFPQTGLAWVVETLRAGKSKLSFKNVSLIPVTGERHPLTKLEGISLYDRARLMEEGVANIEHLAHHDLVDLMLKTRISGRRLIDAVDQAILYLHLSGSENASGEEKSKDVDRLSDDLIKLRKYGIRTASDLERTYKAACNRDGPGEEKNKQEFLNILKDNSGGLSRLRVVLDAVRDDEWMREVRHWRWTSQNTLTVDVEKLNEICSGKPPVPDLRPDIANG